MWLSMSSNALSYINGQICGHFDEDSENARGVYLPLCRCAGADVYARNCSLRKKTESLWLKRHRGIYIFCIFCAQKTHPDNRVASSHKKATFVFLPRLNPFPSLRNIFKIWYYLLRCSAGTRLSRSICSSVDVTYLLVTCIMLSNARVGGGLQAYSIQYYSWW